MLTTAPSRVSNTASWSALLCRNSYQSLPTIPLQSPALKSFLVPSWRYSSTAARPTTECPYKAKRPWPPDMSKLSSKHQFRLERRYRRRAKLKYARPAWAKWTKLVQWGSIGCALFSFFLLLLLSFPFYKPITEIVVHKSRETNDGDLADLYFPS